MEVRVERGYSIVELYICLNGLAPCRAVRIPVQIMGTVSLVQRFISLKRSLAKVRDRFLGL